jgi:hypothetical protein
VQSILHHYQGGVLYDNGGKHSHLHPTHLLHLSKDEKAQLQEIIQTHPKLGALRLVVGVPGLDGPGKSVADISPILMNVDRVCKEKQSIKLSHYPGGDHFLDQLAAFDQCHPGFIVHSQLGKVTVLVLQSAWMATQLLKDTVLHEPVNGLVSDAAHGYWHMDTGTWITGY